MARYFFRIIENGETSIDDVGFEASEDSDIRLEAMRALPAIAKEVVPLDGDRQAFTVLVQDDTGKTVYTATLTFAGVWVRLPEVRP